MTVSLAGRADAVVGAEAWARGGGATWGGSWCQELPMYRFTASPYTCSSSAVYCLRPGGIIPWGPGFRFQRPLPGTVSELRGGGTAVDIRSRHMSHTLHPAHTAHGVRLQSRSRSDCQPWAVMIWCCRERAPGVAAGQQEDAHPHVFREQCERRSRRARLRAPQSRLRICQCRQLSLHARSVYLPFHLPKRMPLWTKTCIRLPTCGIIYPRNLGFETPSNLQHTNPSSCLAP